MNTQEMAPFDLVDFCWLTAGAAYHPLLPLAIGQWVIRRSPTACQWIAQTTQRILSPVQETLTLPSPASETPPVQLHQGDVLTRLSQAEHVLIIGGTGGGKSTLLHALARRWHTNGARVMMCDPDSIAGEYGYRCVGAGDDYPAIGQALTVLAAEMNKRRLQRKQGTRRFAPIWVFVDEVHDVVREVDGAWGVLDDGLRRGRKLDIHLGLGTQDAQVRNLGLEGKGQLLNNLTRVLITRTGDTRWAVVGDEEFVLPALPSPDDMVKPGSSPPQNTETDPLLATLLGSVSGSLKPKTTQTTETTKPVFGNDLNQAIRERLAAGESKNKVCTWLAETHGIRNKVTALKLIQQAKQ